MALVHDLAECIVGDLTPLCGVSETEKHQKEDKAMRELAHLAGPAGEEMYALYRVSGPAFGGSRSDFFGGLIPAYVSGVRETTDSGSQVREGAGPVRHAAAGVRVRKV